MSTIQQTDGESRVWHCSDRLSSLNAPDTTSGVLARKHRHPTTREDSFAAHIPRSRVDTRPPKPFLFRRVIVSSAAPSLPTLNRGSKLWIAVLLLMVARLAADERLELRLKRAQAAVQAATEYMSNKDALPRREPVRGLATLPAGSGVVEIILAERTDIEFIGTHLVKAIEYLGQRHRFQFLFDEHELKRRDIGIDVAVNCMVSDVPLSVVLDHVFLPIGLDYLIRDDILVITSQQAVAAAVETRLYDLRTCPQAMTPELVADVIRRTVRPGTWLREIEPQAGDRAAGTTDPPENRHGDAGQTASDADHPCVCGIAPIPEGLVVTQSWRGHQEIERLLAHLQSFYAPAAANDEADSPTPEQTVATLRSRLDLASTQIVRLQRTALELLEEAQRLETERDTEAQKIDVLKKQISAWQQEYRETLGQLERLKDRLVEFEDLQDRVESLRRPAKE